MGQKMTMIFPKKREKQLITYHYLRLVFFYLPGRCYTQSSSKSSRCSIPRPHLDCVIGQKSVGIWNNNIKVSSTNLCIYIYIYILSLFLLDFPTESCLVFYLDPPPIPFRQIVPVGPFAQIKSCREVSRYAGITFTKTASYPQHFLTKNRSFLWKSKY